MKERELRERAAQKGKSNGEANQPQEKKNKIKKASASAKNQENIPSLATNGKKRWKILLTGTIEGGKIVVGERVKKGADLAVKKDFRIASTRDDSEKGKRPRLFL